MKITNINARMDSSGKHNDRNFDIDSAEHIDKTRTLDNLYWTYNGDYEHTFEEIEAEFYKVHFSDHINMQNAINEKARHKERNSTIDSYRKNYQTRPEDKILQIGTIKEHATKEQLWECACEYRDRFNAIYGEHCKILDMALHMDESTPHVHVRRVWITTDKKGNECVGQNGALSDLGITAPDAASPITRFNNAKMSFTETDLRLFTEICEEKGIDVDKDPLQKRKRLSLLEYKVKEEQGNYDMLRERVMAVSQELRELEDLTSSIKEQFDILIKNIEMDPFFSVEQIENIRNLKEKKSKSLYSEVIKAYREAYGTFMDKGESFEMKVAKMAAGREVRDMENFLRQRGLYEEYFNSRNKHKSTDINKAIQIISKN